MDSTMDMQGGPVGERLLSKLGIDLAPTPAARRFAFECFDSIEHDSHLAGILGDRLLAALLHRGWAERPDPQTRTVLLTRAGAAGLRGRAVMSTERWAQGGVARPVRYA